MIMTGSHDGSVDYLIQSIHTEQAGSDSVVFLGSGSSGSLGCSLLILDAAEQIQHLIRGTVVTILIGIFRNGRCKAGKTGIQLIRVFHFRNDQYDTIRIQRDGLDHQGNIFCLKTKFKIGLLHHIAEQRFCLFRAVSKLTYFQFAAGEIFTGQRAANLIFIYFFYFHATTLPFCLRIGMVYSLYFPYILVNRRSSLFKKI